jgi:hypothetical protein
MNKNQIIKGLKAIKQKCKEYGSCEGCELECYCQHRRVYGSPHLFPNFNNELVMVKDVHGKLLIIDLDKLFNELNRICSTTNYCQDCVLRRECEKTCGFTIVPERWCLGGLVWKR